jgi:hypothetical protein
MLAPAAFVEAEGGNFTFASIKAAGLVKVHDEVLSLT